jgi:antitoxin (DNA-binding transcriptional repressor) of toxin-antitoxin stability system
MGVPAVDLTDMPGSLNEIVEEASRSGGEVLLTRGGEAVAKIIPLQRKRQPRRPGSAHGQIHMADDFNETPEELLDYF